MFETIHLPFSRKDQYDKLITKLTNLMLTNEAEFLSYLTSGWPENQSLLYRICLDPDALQIFSATFGAKYPALIMKSHRFIARIQRTNNPLSKPDPQHQPIVQPQVNLFPQHTESSFFLWRWIARGLGYIVSACFLRHPAEEKEREICLRLLNRTSYRKSFNVQNGAIFSRSFFIPAADGQGNLHTSEISGDKKFSSAKPWILYLPTASGHLMHQIDWICAENFDLNKYNVAAFNPRGSHLSEGWYANSYEVLQDVILQVNRLLDKGVPPHRIILAGHCYGGDLACMVAGYFNTKGVTFGLFSDRAAGEVDEVSQGYLETVGSGTGHTITVLGRILAFIVGPIVKFFLWLTDFNLPAVQAYAKFPEDRKAHLCLRSSKETRADFPDDNVIAHSISMHKTMKPLMLDENGNLNISPKQKAKRKQAKFVYDPNPQWCEFHGLDLNKEKSHGHSVLLSALRQSHGNLNGREYFTQFADRVTSPSTTTSRS